MKKLLLDVDGVLAEFIGSFTKKAHELGSGVLPYLTKHQEQWDFNNMPRQVVRATWDWVAANKGEFWGNLAPAATAEEFARIEEMDRAHSKYEVYFVTSRMDGGKFWTEHWLRRQGISDPTVVICHRKAGFAQAVGIDASLDDKAGNAIALAYGFLDAKKGTSYVLDRLYNRFDPEVVGSKVVRVETVGQFLDKVEAG